MLYALGPGSWKAPAGYDKQEKSSQQGAANTHAPFHAYLSIKTWENMYTNTATKNTGSVGGFSAVSCGKSFLKGNKNKLKYCTSDADDIKNKEKNLADLETDSQYDHKDVNQYNSIKKKEETGALLSFIVSSNFLLF